MCWRRCPRPTRSRAVGRLAPALGEADALVEQSVGDVVDGGHAVDEEELLEHEADELAIAPPTAARSLIARRLDPGDADDAAGRPIERADDVQQRRFAGSGRADDRRELAVLDGSDTSSRAAIGGLPGYCLQIPISSSASGGAVVATVGGTVPASAVGSIVSFTSFMTAPRPRARRRRRAR